MSPIQRKNKTPHPNSTGFAAIKKKQGHAHPFVAPRAFPGRGGRQKRAPLTAVVPQFDISISTRLSPMLMVLSFYCTLLLIQTPVSFYFTYIRYVVFFCTPLPVIPREKKNKNKERKKKTEKKKTRKRKKKKSTPPPLRGSEIRIRRHDPYEIPADTMKDPRGKGTISIACDTGLQCCILMVLRNGIQRGAYCLFWGTHLLFCMYRLDMTLALLASLFADTASMMIYIYDDTNLLPSCYPILYHQQEEASKY